MDKKLGLILMIIGVVLIALPLVLPSIVESIPFIGGNNLYIIVAGIVLVVIGFLFTKGNKTEKEVPIYHGSKIVGYRRH